MDGALRLVDAFARRFIPAKRVCIGIKNPEIESKSVSGLADLKRDDLYHPVDPAIPSEAATRKPEGPENSVHAYRDCLTVEAHDPQIWKGGDVLTPQS
jgi:hypothetical protein